MRLSVAIMHHPARPELPERLRFDLAPTRVDVVTDPDPFGDVNPWRTAREAWARTPSWCTHRLVLQDDVMPCPGFVPAVRRAIKAKPDVGLSFFMGMYGTQSCQRMLTYASMCLHWSPLHFGDWVPTLALCLPRAWAVELAAFLPDHPRPIADDEVAGWWMNARQRVILQSIPALVQHDADAVSTIAGHAGSRRVAACWIGEHDVASIDWTHGP